MTSLTPLMLRKGDWTDLRLWCLRACVLLGVGFGLECKTAAAEGSSVVLARDGRTEFSIVLPDEPSDVDHYAAKQLALYLKLSTGAEFPVVGAGDFTTDNGPGIFLGRSASAEKALGSSPVADLKKREHVSLAKDGSIFLYGQGNHGNLYAVVDFMENAIGWRWFSLFEPPVFTRHETLVLEPFERREAPSFDYVHVDFQRGPDFSYLQGNNLQLDPMVRSLVESGVDTEGYRHFVSEEAGREIFRDGGHTLFSFIPPVPDAPGANRFKWLKKRDYFETNPEFFSMNANGQRVPDLQLNFGNSDLRKEFTKNVLELIATEGDDILIEIGAMDLPGRFCHSPESIELEKKYQSPTGPIIDYLIELCGVLREKYPKVRIKTLAYRRAQTQRPPVLPEGEKLPDNLIVEFAPIEDNYFADWSNKDEAIQETIRDLKGWAEITASGNLRAWIYPNPYGTGYGMPVGNVGRTIRNMRLMHEWGVRGVFVDMIGISGRSGFSELHQYLILKLAMNVSGDTDRWIEEFTDTMYGSAAPVFREYLTELEKARESMSVLPKNVNYNSQNLNLETFPYLTPENIHRWQGFFDRMEGLLSEKEKRAKINVKLARRELDLATLWRWFDLQDRYPDSYKDHSLVAGRIREANAASPESMPPWHYYDQNRIWSTHPVRTGWIEEFSNAILAGRQKEKPYPEALQGIPHEKIRAFLPIRSLGPDEAVNYVFDPDASTGLALVTDGQAMPHAFAFGGGTPPAKGRQLILDKAQIVPGKYHLYELGEIVLTDGSLIALSPSWASQLKVAEHLYEPGSENKWKAYISAKFEGEIYGGSERQNRVLVDRIFLVQQGLGQFAPEHEQRQ